MRVTFTETENRRILSVLRRQYNRPLETEGLELRKKARISIWELLKRMVVEAMGWVGSSGKNETEKRAVKEKFNKSPWNKRVLFEPKFESRPGKVWRAQAGIMFQRAHHTKLSYPEETGENGTFSHQIFQGKDCWGQYTSWDTWPLRKLSGWETVFHALTGTWMPSV